MNGNGRSRTTQLALTMKWISHYAFGMIAVYTICNMTLSANHLRYKGQFVTGDLASKIIDRLSPDGCLTKKYTVPNTFGKGGDSLNYVIHTAFGVDVASIGSVEGTVLAIRKLWYRKSDCAKLVG